MTATLRQFAHRDGYGRTHLDEPFWLVQCDDCRVVCNSGHHYDDPVWAQLEADRHNSAVHA